MFDEKTYLELAADLRKRAIAASPEKAAELEKLALYFAALAADSTADLTPILFAQ